MLKGDKIETTISIAFSERSLSKNDHYIIIAKCTSRKDIENNRNALSSRGYNSLVIDGSSLELVIQHFLDRFIYTRIYTVLLAADTHIHKRL